MKCDESVERYCSSLCGVRLFYHIVDDAQTATTLIRHLNEAQMPGEWQFMALNLVENDREFDERKLLEHLEYPEGFGNIFEYILAVGSMEMRSSAQDSSDSPRMSENMRLFRNFREYQRELSSLDLEQSSLDDQFNSIQQEIRTVDSEMKSRKTMLTHISKAKAKLKTLAWNEQILETRKQKMMKQQTKCQEELDSLMKEKDSLETQHALPLFTKEEAAVIGDLRARIVNKTDTLEHHSKRLEVTRKKVQFAQHFGENELLKTRTENAEKLKSIEEKTSALSKIETKIQDLADKAADSRRYHDRLRATCSNRIDESKIVQILLNEELVKRREINEQSVKLANQKYEAVSARKKCDAEVNALKKRYKNTSVDSEEIIFTKEEVTTRRRWVNDI